ncbi:MAG: alpha/beta fold hydrolase [Candidatus Wallbacteria bacterium]|nr:alpha/beta fold hydrolase [Candidatus Wallbacteria bacterium]
MFPDTDLFLSPVPFLLQCGRYLPQLTLSYHSWGKLNPARDNAVLICHFFSGSKHAAGRYPDQKIPGWWEALIGPGKPFDTDRFFVICSDTLCCMQNSSNVLSCGPRTIDPDSGRPFRASFPPVTIRDMVRAQKLLLDSLNIEHPFAIAGPSMGGMQALAWGVLFPDASSRIIAVTAGSHLDGFARIFPMRIGMQQVTNDPCFIAGSDQFPDDPWHSFVLALEGLTLASRSREWADLSVPPDSGYGFAGSFSDLREDEQKIMSLALERARQYNPYCFVQLCNANLRFELFEGIEPDKALKDSVSSYLLIAEKHDLLFPPEQIVELSSAIRDAGRHVEYCSFSCSDGHLGGITHTNLFAEKIREFLTTTVPALPG